jgi:peptide/nickel transport system ATP-binding protein
MAMLEIRDLNVTYMTKKRPPFHAVKDANLNIEPGEIVGLVGESGSGKSTLGTAVLRLLAPPGEITGGQVIFDGKDITTWPEEKMRPLRWREMSTVFQSSMNALNPVLTIGAQFRDVIKAHSRASDRQIGSRTGELLQMVDIDPSYVRFYPHELSGGMKQRVALALSLAMEPKFVLLDEPTTGLDVVVQRSILENLKQLQREHGFSVLIISHDLGAIMDVADRVAVMYDGVLVDNQPAKELLLHPKDDYSKLLIGSYAELWKPVVDDLHMGLPSDVPAGSTLSAHEVAQADKHAPVMQVESISRQYTRRRGFSQTVVDAVSNVSFTLRKGYITALVGQSGSGKSTIGRLVTGVEHPDSGTIRFGDVVVNELSRKELRKYRSKVQLVFQDPYAALNPAHPISHILARPLANYMGIKGRKARERVAAVLEQVGLEPAERFIDKFPHQLSGGQRQRVVVARALLSEPEIIIADEPTSMLDVTIRAEILEILNRLVRDQGIAMLYITHDLLSARALADEILVLNRGRVVEDGDADKVIQDPQHEYTRLLLSSIPNPFAIAEAAD